MHAADEAADETVAFLLSKGADPEIMDDREWTALTYAIDSKCPTTIDLLAPATRKCLKKSIQFLATRRAEQTPAVTELLRRAALDKDTARMGLDFAAKFGATGMLKLLLEGWHKNTLPPSADVHAQCPLLRFALLSDNVETVKAVLSFTSSVCSHNISFALTRGRTDMIDLFGLTEDNEIENSKLKLKEEIMNKTAPVEDRIPKCVEFQYDNEMVKLRPLLSQDTVLYEDLLRALHVPPVHAEEECPEDCRQKEDCNKLRQVYYLVRLLVDKMGKSNPVFRLGPNRHPVIIGSMKEHTRAFYTNEVDVHISLNKILGKKFHFDQIHQQLKATENLDEKDHINKYVSNEGVFDCKKYSLGFMEYLEQALNQIDMSQGFRIGDKEHKFTMERPTNKYEPCLRCMLTSEAGRPQVRRCRHGPDCLPHKQGEGECFEGCKENCESFFHTKTCNCQEYTSPALTITKIGLALHVRFLQKDGTFTHIDCDINIPTIPTCTRYDGDIDAIQHYLEKLMPVGWMEELSKLDNMSAASYMPHLVGVDSWQVKMRMINRETVLPRQVKNRML